MQDRICQSDTIIIIFILFIIIIIIICYFRILPPQNNLGLGLGLGNFQLTLSWNNTMLCHNGSW